MDFVSLPGRCRRPAGSYKKMLKPGAARCQEQKQPELPDAVILYSKISPVLPP